jgi:molybdopterin molybdotransferase
MNRMITFPKAIEILLANVPQMPAERIRIEVAAGRVLRQTVSADRDFPPFDRVMMDGYALRIADLAATRDFSVAASAPAGAPAVSLPDTCGACIEVMTGAPLPRGADCIVPVENTRPDKTGIRILLDFEAAKNRFVHPSGSDAKKGEPLLEPGTRLGSREIGVAVSCGAAWLEVSQLPRIAVIATGDELIAVDGVPAAHQIRQSNAHAISAALGRAGFPVITSGCIGDEQGSSATSVQSLLEASDWIILTGAVSKGARDFVPALLASLGCRKLFHGVAQRPGKPAGCWLGPSGQVIMALPGNPVSAITGLHAFVLPALAVSAGMRPPQPRLVTASEKLPGLSGMTQHLPVTLAADGKSTAAPTGNSGDFIGLLHSDGFITIPPHGEFAAAYHYTPWL